MIKHNFWVIIRLNGSKIAFFDSYTLAVNHIRKLSKAHNVNSNYYDIIPEICK